MLLSIYWEGLALSLAVVLVLYYVILFVVAKYARQEMVRLARWASSQKKERNIDLDEETDEDVPGMRMAYLRKDVGDLDRVMERGDGNKPGYAHEPEEWQPPAQEIRGLIPVMHDLAIEMRQFGEKKVRTGMVREELIMGLRGILDKDVYKVLKDAEFEEFVKAMVLISVSRSCSILLDAGELERMWGG